MSQSVTRLTGDSLINKVFEGTGADPLGGGEWWLERDGRMVLACQSFRLTMGKADDSDCFCQFLRENECGSGDWRSKLHL